MRSALLATCLLAFIAATASARPGDLDESFGRGGVHVEPFDRGGIAEMARLSDGRIVVTAQGTFGEGLAIARLLPDGSLDRTFGTDGRTVTRVEASDFSPLAVQPDRRIVVAGQRARTSYEDEPPMEVERYTAEGIPDTTFGGDGRVEIAVGTSAPNFAPQDVVSAMELLPDGRILVGGHSYSARGTFFVLARLLPDGTLDRTFGDGGVALHRLSAPSFVAAPNDLIVRGGGRIIGVGYQTADDPSPPYQGASRTRPMLAGFRPDGRLDPAFGRRGRTVLTNPDDAGPLVGSVTAPGGHVVALQEPPSTSIGFQPRNGLETSFVLRSFDRRGRVERAFGTRGRAKLTLSEPAGEDGWDLAPAAIARQPDGKLLAVGTVSRCFIRGPCDAWPALGRFTSRGRADREFGNRGSVVTKAGDRRDEVYGPPSYYAEAHALVLPGDERPLVGGGGSQDGQGGLMLLRYSDSVAPRGALPLRAVVRGGRARVRVACREAGPTCTGEIVMRAPRSGRRRAFAVGRARLETTPGSPEVVEIRLSRRARRALTAGTLTVAARLEWRDANGNTATVARRLVLAG